MTPQRHLPTSRELAVWRAYLESFEAVRARVDARLHRDSDLSSGDYKILLALSEAESHELRSSELAAHILWERSRLSAHLGRMEKRGLVRRAPCPDDARGAIAILTEAGRRAFRDSTIPHLEAIRSLFVDALTPEQLVVVGDIATALHDHLNTQHPGRP